MAVTIQMYTTDRPTWVEALKGTNPKATFRAAVANRMRPRLNDLKEECQEITRYPKIASTFKVRQRTTEAGMEFSLVSVGRGSILETAGGTRPHTIVQEPHLIPRYKLETWLDKGGSWGSVPENVWTTAAHVQQVLNRRMIIIPHPGTEPDQPVDDAVMAHSARIRHASYDAVEYWTERFGATGETSYEADGDF